MPVSKMKLPTRIVIVLCVIVAGVGIGGCGSRKEAAQESPSNESNAGDSSGVAEPLNDSDPPNAVNALDPPRVASADPTLDRDAVITEANTLAGQQKFAAAAAVLRKSLLVEPNDAEVLFLLANVEAASGNLSEAIDLLGEIPADHPEAGVPALGQSADWCFQLERYDEAERRYLQVLERVPQAAPARRQLAFLYNRQGRRHEAARHIRELCKQGDIRQDELHALMVLSDAMYDDPAEPGAVPAGQRPYFPIGASGQARKWFNEKRYEDVVTGLHELVASGSAPPAIVALYGRAAAEAQDDEHFSWWLSKTDDETREFAEYWAAVAAYLLIQRQHEEALCALAEAVDRDPTDLLSIGRLRQAFIVLNDHATANRFESRWDDIRESLRLNNLIATATSPDPDAISELASMLRELDRPLEAVLWSAIEDHYRGTSATKRTQLNAQRQQLVASGNSFPSRSERLCGLDLEQFPLPTIEIPEPTDVQIARRNTDEQAAPPAGFENVADSIGLQHTYHVASQPLKYGFSIYQMLGGAVAALDYDLDGGCDLYLAQGGADPPGFRGEQSNRLFRHAGDKLLDVTGPSATSEFQYSLGLTAGDWNQDGFPDLVITNVGRDVLLINNGDGTFTNEPLSRDSNTNRVPSSAAMADVTGDGLPDIVQASYIDDPRMTLKPTTNASGQPLQPMLPSKFRPGVNHLIENDGSGHFAVKPLMSEASETSTSLGLIVTDFDDEPGNEVFVGNDLKPNQLWVRQPAGGWLDVAPLLGCAFSYTGGATASMGVAASDFENNGTLDLHITNYQDENVSLFLNRGGAFQDRNVQYQLAEPSRAVLGFGTQAIDYDNDGRRDLVVTNGHIEDGVEINASYQQPPQLFSNRGGRFQLARVSDPSGYWASNHLGRGLAKLDFNRDGKMDVVITHIGQPSAMLLNRTPTDHHWLQLELVGTTSERDAIGTRVRVRCGDQEWTDWVIAGDGYLCHNESVLAFGLGEFDRVDEILVRWPDGGEQTFRDVESDSQILIVEGESVPFRLGPTR